jgi:hypothetical protein
VPAQMWNESQIALMLHYSTREARLQAEFTCTVTAGGAQIGPVEARRAQGKSPKVIELRGFGLVGVLLEKGVTDVHAT